MLVRMTIDIMLPFWGAPEKLFLAVESVRAQTDDRWRLTVIDDAYPDDRVAEYFAALNDPRIRYRRNIENRGIVANFQASVDLARSEHLVVFGSDDLLLPDYVATVRRAIERHPSAAMIQPGVTLIDGDGHPAAPLVDVVKQRLLAPRTDRGDVVLRGDALAATLLRGNWLYWPSLVFRRDAINRHRFREDLPIILDLAIILEIVYDDGELVVLPDQVFAYRRHAASASQTSLLDGRRFTDERRFYREAAHRAGAASWPRARRAAVARVFSRLHAATELPRVLRSGTREGRRAVWRHILR